MIYDFFDDFGWAGWFMAAILCASPWWIFGYIEDYKKENEIGFSVRLAYLGILVGFVLIPFLAWGYMVDGKLFSPDGVGENWGRQEKLGEGAIEDWREIYAEANSGFFRPQDIFFLPWFLGLGGLFFGAATSACRQLLHLIPKFLRLRQQRQQKRRAEELQKRQLEDSDRERREAEIQRQQELERNRPPYNDLKSALTYFAEHASEIDSLPIDDDEKELLQMKLQAKKESVLEEYV